MEATIKNLAQKVMVGLVIGLVLSACSITTTSVITDYDRDAQFNSYQTFYWSDDFQIENGKTNDPLFYNTLIKKRLKVAITDEMKGRGYELNAKDPDLLINSHVVVQQKSTSQNNYPYYGYYGFYRGYNTGSMTTTQEREGALIIELIDKDRHQLVWQGYAPNVLQTNTEDKQREIREAVSKIFAKYEYRVDK
ncbi:DUF4136 domain-containing protein [Fulvivirga sp.]|uniref:DUF4136 domain-containing protein n=1 Tax=Fulvivirga sp. TaxID=1931237 RepID=UPI0032EC3085